MFFCFFYVIFPIERRNKKTRKYVWFKTYATASLVSETGPRSSYSDVSCRQKTSMVSYRCRGAARCPKAFSYCLTYSPTIWRRPTRIARGAFCARVQKMYFFRKSIRCVFQTRPSERATDARVNGSETKGISNEHICSAGRRLSETVFYPSALSSGIYDGNNGPLEPASHTARAFLDCTDILDKRQSKKLRWTVTATGVTVGRARRIPYKRYERLRMSGGGNAPERETTGVHFGPPKRLLFPICCRSRNPARNLRRGSRRLGHCLHCVYDNVGTGCRKSRSIEP